MRVHPGIYSFYNLALSIQEQGICLVKTRWKKRKWKNYAEEYETLKRCKTKYYKGPTGDVDCIAVVLPNYETLPFSIHSSNSMSAFRQFLAPLWA